MTNIDNEVLDKYFELHEKFAENTEKINEGVKAVQDQFGHVEHEFERGEKKIKIKESLLWQEVYHLGLKGHQAVEFLREKYADIFAEVDAGEELQKEIRLFEVKHLGFSFTQMNGSNLIKLVKGLIELYAPNKNI